MLWGRMSNKLLELKKKPSIHKKPNQKSAGNSKFSQISKISKKDNYLSRVKELEEQVELLTSYSSDTVYRLNYKTMKYDYISPAVTSLLGFTPKEMSKINFRSLIVETKMVTDGLRKVSSFEELEEARGRGDVGKWQADYLIRTKSGDKIWVSDVSNPWFDNRGNVIGSVGSLRNITDRVRVEEQILGNFDKLAVADPLTGLPGKAEFFSELEYEIKRTKRTGEDFSLVIFDIDGLEKINADIGKDFGDETILKFSNILENTLRETDIVSRTGGGSFGVILPDTPMKGAYYLAERVRSEVAGKKFVISGDLSSFSFSVSAGVATFEAIDEVSATDLYKLADTRLYVAKNTGRNQVSVDEIVGLH